MATQAGAGENLFARPWNLLEMTAVEARVARAHAADTAELPAEEVGSVEDIVIPGPAGPIPARVYRSKGSSLGKPKPILLWLHGGGMVLGANYVQSDRPIRRIVGRVDCIVVAVDFRLAPEDPWPAGIDDCKAALRWVYDHGREIGGDPSRIAIEGDSGGGLPCASCALYAREQGIPLSHLLLIYPNLDCSMESPTWDTHAHTSLNRTSMRWFLDKYLPVGIDARDPAVSPGRAADLAGLPSATIIIAGKDPLCGEARDFGERLAATGVDVDIREWDEMPHGFYVMTAIYPEAMDANLHAAARLLEAFSA